MHREEASYLIGEASKAGHPSMVHGTSVEPVIELLKTGTLPLSPYREEGEHPVDQGYLFFVPRKKSFQSHPLFDDISIDLEGGKLEDTVGNYALDHQQLTFMRNLLGYWPKNVLPGDPGNYTSQGLRRLREQGVNTQKILDYGIKRLLEDVERRKGVCIGLNNAIFELEVLDGCDDPGREVMIHLPEGLDIRYVQYVYPFGELEEEILEEFIGGLPQKPKDPRE